MVLSKVILLNAIRVWQVLVFFIFVVAFDKYKFADIVSASNLAIVCMAFMLIISKLPTGKLVVPVNIGVPLFILMACSLISYIGSENKPVAARQEVTYIASMMIVVIFINVVDTKIKFIKIVKIFFQASMVFSILAIIQFAAWAATGNVYYGEEIYGAYGASYSILLLKANYPFGSGLILGHFFLLPAITGLSVWTHLKNEKDRYFIKLATVLSIIAALLTFARSAWLTLGCFIVYLLFKKKKELNKIVRPFFIGAFCIFAIVISVPIFNFTMNKVQSLSTYNRLGIIMSSISHISDAPFFGHGLGTKVGQELPAELYSLARQNIRPGKSLDIDTGKTHGRETHNTFLQVGVDLGLVGLMGYLIFIYGVWTAGSIGKRGMNPQFMYHLQQGVLMAFVFSTICSIFLSGLLIKQTWIVAGLAIAGGHVGRVRTAMKRPLL